MSQSITNLIQQCLDLGEKTYLYHQDETFSFKQLVNDLKTIDLSPLYHHPKSDKTFCLIQEKHPFYLIQQFLSALDQGLDPIILDPQLEPSTLLKQWNLKLGKPQLKASQLHPSFWCATSGSSGPPKAIGHPLENAMLSWSLLKDRLKMSPKTWGLVLPTHHMGGLMVLLRQLFAGHQVISTHYEKLFAGNIFPEAVSLVPTQLYRLSDQEQLKQMQLILLGGADCSEELIKKARSQKWPLILGYGSTETCSAVSLYDIQKHSEDVHLGDCLEQVSFSSDELGCLRINTPTRHTEMINDGQYTKVAGAISTSDLVLNNQAGYFFYQGRMDDIFISGGENISPHSIEQRLKPGDEIDSFLITSRPHPELLEAGHLLAFLKKPAGLDAQYFATLRRIRHDLNQTLPKLQRPKTISLHDPLNSLKIPRADFKKLIIDKFREIQQKPLLVFLHGLFGHGEDFDQLMGALSIEVDPLSMVAPTLPGHERPDEGSPSFDLTDKSTFLSGLHKKIQRMAENRPIILIGYSLGGRLSMELKSRYPNSYQHLAIISAHPGLQDALERKARLEHDLALVQRFEPITQFLTDWYNQPLFATLKDHEHFAQRLERQQFASISRLKEFFRLTSLGNQGLMDESLKMSDCLYLYGQKDLKFALLKERYEDMGAKVESVPDCGHALVLEAPEMIAKSLIQWLRNDFTQV
jgi:2-succinyl-6-hydroxy-2,4-cyclohexadiene-1-carboxylate synthase